MKYFQTQIRVRYIETDAMGVAHHASYCAWLEQARIEFLDAIGLPYAHVERQGIYIPVISLNMTYKKPIVFDDRIWIDVRTDQQPKLKFKIDYTLKREEHIMALACTEHVFLNQHGQPMKPYLPYWDKLSAYPTQQPASEKA